LFYADWASCWSLTRQSRLLRKTRATSRLSFSLSERRRLQQPPTAAAQPLGHLLPRLDAGASATVPRPAATLWRRRSSLSANKLRTHTHTIETLAKMVAVCLEHYATQLYRAIAPLQRVLVRAAISDTHALSFVPNSWVYSHKIIVFSFNDAYHFAVLQSAIHEVWMRRLTSTLGAGTNYSPTDCFDTFPFPPAEYAALAQGGWSLAAMPEPFHRAAQVGGEYHDHRAQVMRARNHRADQGLQPVPRPRLRRRGHPTVARAARADGSCGACVLRLVGSCPRARVPQKRAGSDALYGLARRAPRDSAPPAGAEPGVESGGIGLTPVRGCEGEWMTPSVRSGKGTSVRHKVFRFSPRGRERAGALWLTPFVSRLAGEGVMECGSEASAHAERASALRAHPSPTLCCEGERACTPQAMYPDQLCPPLPPRGRGGLWSAEAKLPPTLKLALQHSKNTARGTPLPHCGRGAGGEGERALAHSELKQCTLISFVPLSRGAGEGDYGVRTPLSHAVGEGLGVRAKKRANPAHSELKRCTLIRNLKEGVINYCFL
jgi:hypothetical protein